VDKEKEDSKIEEINIANLEVKDDGEKLDLHSFMDWYVWIEEKEKDSIFGEKLNKGSE